jgi:hypothetical protein
VRNKITTLYNSYSENHNIVLPRHQYLFHNRTLEECLGASFDNMSAWIRSVEEAMLVLQHPEASHQAVSQLIHQKCIPVTLIQPIALVQLQLQFLQL